MKIVQIVTRMDVIGGAQIHVLELSKGLAALQHEVTIISSGEGTLTKALHDQHIPYHSLTHLQTSIHPLRDIYTYVAMRQLLKKINPDLIAIHSSKAGIIGRLAGRSLNIPTVFTAHSWSFANVSNPIIRYAYIGIEWIISRLKTGIISVSHYDERLANQYLNSPYTKRRVIHNGIRNRAVKAAALEKTQTVRLIMIARFAHPKDHELLLHALVCLKETNWHVTFVGDGPLRPGIEDKARTLHLEDRITFLGEVNNVAALLEQSDILLLISTSEGLPISILEAMRAQLAIIASDVGGVAEMIDHQKNGVLVSPSAVHELAGALNLLMHNPSKCTALAQQARKKFEQQFTFETMLHHTVSFYEQIKKDSPLKRKVGI